MFSCAQNFPFFQWEQPSFSLPCDSGGAAIQYLTHHPSWPVMVVLITWPQGFLQETDM